MFVHKKTITYAILCCGIISIQAQTVEQFFHNERTAIAVGTGYYSDCSPIQALWEHIPNGDSHVFENPDMRLS